MAEQNETVISWKSKIRNRTVRVGGSLTLAGAAVVIGILGMLENKDDSLKGLKNEGPSVERFVNPTPTNPELGDASHITPNETNIFKDINEIRKAANLTPLEFDIDLSRLSQQRSKDMVENNYFSHYDQDGEPYFSVMITASCDNPELTAMGENLEMNNHSDSSIEAVEAWMESEEHKDNILNPDWRSIGVGEAKDDQGRVFFTTLFSDKPCETPYQFEAVEK